MYEKGTKEYLEYLKNETPGQSEKVDSFIMKDQEMKKENSKKHFSQVFQNPLKGFPYNEEFVVTEEVETLDENKEAIKKKAEKSGMPYGILKKVFDRGVAAWRTGHRPGTTPAQWGLARVNSFTTKSKGTWGGADQDLAKQVG